MRSRKNVSRHTPRKSSKPTGYVLYEDASIVVIATMETGNTKTGNMVQIWILPATISPTDAVKTGLDSTVCFDCKHRGQIVDGKVTDRTCYVTVFQAPLAVWNAWRRGRYPKLRRASFRRVFGGRKVRFGAYGEPVLIPISILRAISYVADGWTGYTHQWQRAEFSEYRHFLMASCDSEAEFQRAKQLGWRTFRVRTATDALLTREIACPASDEMNHRTTCERCGLCNGSRGANDLRKDIAIIVHGSSAAKFINITASIKLAA